MKRVSITEAKRRFPALVRQVEMGESVVITRNGEPVADVVPHKRKGGINWEGLRRWKEEHGVDRIFTYISDDFDDPLPEDFLITPQP